jgi:hypothetical protein
MAAIISTFEKFSPILTIAAMLATASSAPARASELDSNPVVEARMTGSTPCVSLVGNTLDLRVLAGGSDIVSLDAGVAIGNGGGEVTLYVALGSQTGERPVSVTFESASDVVGIGDSQNSATLIPNSSLQPVVGSFPFVAGRDVEVIVYSPESNGQHANTMADPPPDLGASNKAVLRPVSTCPRVQ